MLHAKNLDAFFKTVKDWSAQQKVVVGAVGRGLSAYAFNYIPTVSAQNSGDFAANWKYSVGSVDTSFASGVLPDLKGRLLFRYTDLKNRHRVYESGRIQGHPDAVSYAYASNRGKDGEFVFGSTAYISNSATHDEAYAWKIENGTIKFRPGNTGHPVANTLSLMTAQFGGVLSPTKINMLMNTRIGRGM